jgi:peptide alpha-N-acetyltransferase
MSKIDTTQVQWREYSGEPDLDIVIKLIEKELSEPYPIFTYRYFVDKWPALTLIVNYPNSVFV